MRQLRIVFALFFLGNSLLFASDSIREIFTAKPYLNPIIMAVTQSLQITIDLQTDPKDIDHDNALEMVHSIDQDNPVEKASYDKYSCMDGCMPDTKPDGRITQNELMFYFDVIARYNENSPIHEQYAPIHAEIEAIKKAEKLVDPIADPEGLLKQTLIDNIPILANTYAPKELGVPLFTYLLQKFPGQKVFLEKAKTIVSKMPLQLVNDKSNPAYAEIKEPLYDLLRESLPYKAKAFLIHQLMYLPRMLHITFKELGEQGEASLIEQTSTDMLRLGQYPTDTERTGMCRNVARLFVAFADQFEIPAATVSLISANTEKEVHHEYAVAFTQIENLKQKKITIDLDAFDVRERLLNQYVVRKYYNSAYNLIGEYALTCQILPVAIQEELSAYWYGIAFDYGATTPELSFISLGSQYVLHNNPMLKYSKTFEFKATSTKDFFNGLFDTMPNNYELQDYIKKMRLLGVPDR